ncbi:unnamed protein product [Didymodactylos carnosus]|uniref:Uncharacterized protein n=1 Tax=Didymodactylos carnosus TaxID=1234261 RepID=A0A8S2F8U7_9BILA|nr:unnamed protein product [Didymodactylos carnosus]CAF4202589.1 unnamed protein product [Didymodactylos carnosus]
MFATTILLHLLIFSIIPSSHGQTCPDNQSVCGWAGCYNPINQSCYDSSVLNCPHNCHGLCYNNTDSYCFNDTFICKLTQQPCTISDYPYLTCYDPSYQVCLNQTMCNTSTLCGNPGQCVPGGDACVDNTTICPTSIDSGEWQNPASVKLCNGTCYRISVQKCINESTIECVANCGNQCYNETKRQCFNNATLCDLTDSICGLTCYDPKYQVCLNNNTPCYKDDVCGTNPPQCLDFYKGDVCVNNETICSGYSRYAYQLNQTSPVQLCNGICYDSSILNCTTNGTIQCANPTCKFCYL